MQFPHGRRILRALQFLQLRSQARRNGDYAEQHAAHAGAWAGFLQVVGSVGFDFGGAEHQIEVAHGDDLAELGIGDPHKNADRFLHAAQLGFFNRERLRGNGSGNKLENAGWSGASAASSNGMRT